jgi:hypothetical protein
MQPLDEWLRTQLPVLWLLLALIKRTVECRPSRSGSRMDGRF